MAKFFEPAHYVGQVGFSSAVHAMVRRPAWAPFVDGFDATFTEDFHHVIADMNGSPIFLFSALKMKLKMAARRRHAHERGPPREAGPLTDGEAEEYELALGELLRLFDLDRR